MAPEPGFRALAHPLRPKLLKELVEERSPLELAEALNEPIGTVAYHVRQLAKAGLIRPTRETRRRGAVEHYYRLDRRGLRKTVKALLALLPE